MKILYTTDLHGALYKYKKIIEIQDEYDVIIIGGDITPNDESFNPFICKYLPSFFSEIKKPIILDYANDDLLMEYEFFKKIVSKFEHVYLHHKNLIRIEDISFIGMNYVPDYHFQLKDWCRADDKEHIVCPQQNGKGIYTNKKGIYDIDDLYEYFAKQLSIEEILVKLPQPETDKVIYIFHSPPRNLKLDVCADRREVGSFAITKFIERNQPLATLHGHIHESPVYGKQYNKLGNTICIQPGQSHKSSNTLIVCKFDTDDIEGTIKFLNVV